MDFELENPETVNGKLRVVQFIKNRPVEICELVFYPVRSTFTRSGTPFWLISFQTVKMLISHISCGGGGGGKGGGGFPLCISMFFCLHVCMLFL